MLHFNKKICFIVCTYSRESSISTVEQYSALGPANKFNNGAVLRPNVTLPHAERRVNLEVVGEKSENDQKV